MICKNCNQEVEFTNAKFCSKCGNGLPKRRIKTFISKASESIRETTKDIIAKTNEMRANVASKLDGYIEMLRNDNAITIAGHNIPISRREQIISQLERIRNSISREDFQSDEEYQEWISQLDDRISNKKCIICFGLWSNGDDVVVCKYCIHGGHKDHFLNWVSNNPICPLCREKLTKTDLIGVKTI